MKRGCPQMPGVVVERVLGKLPGGEVLEPRSEKVDN